MPSGHLLLSALFHSLVHMFRHLFQSSDFLRWAHRARHCYLTYAFWPTPFSLHLSQTVWNSFSAWSKLVFIFISLKIQFHLFESHLLKIPTRVIRNVSIGISSSLYLYPLLKKSSPWISKILPSSLRHAWQYLSNCLCVHSFPN